MDNTMALYDYESTLYAVFVEDDTSPTAYLVLQKSVFCFFNLTYLLAYLHTYLLTYLLHGEGHYSKS
jgi:hypothetical protein